MKHKANLQRIICFLVVLISLNLSADNGNAKIRKQLSKASAPEKARLYNDLAYNFLDFYPDSASYYASLALKFATETNLDLEKARAYFSIAYSNELKGEYFMALEGYMKSLDLYYKLENEAGIASLTSYIGTLYKMTGDYPVALNYFYTSLDYYGRLNDKTGLAYAWNNIGVTLYCTGANERAKTCYSKAIALFRETGDSMAISSTYNNLGLLAIGQDKESEALSLFEKALDFSIGMNYQEGIATAYSNIGDVYEHSGDYETALQYYQMAIESPALEFQYTRKTNNFLKMADIYLRQKKDPLAIQYYQKAKDLAIQHHLRPQLVDVYFALSHYYDAKQDWKNALLNYKEYSAIKDSIFNTQLAEQLAKSNVRLEIFEKEQENQDLLQLNKMKELESVQVGRINLILIAATIVFLVLLIIIYSRLRKIHTQNQLLLERQVVIENSNKQLKVLKEKLSQNVTDRTKQLELEIEKRKEAEKNLDNSLKESQNLNNFKSQLLNNLNQELRNTLNGVLGFSGLIAEEISKTAVNPKLLEYNHIVLEHSKQLYHSIQSIQTLQVIERSSLNKQFFSFSAHQFFNDILHHMRTLYPDINIEECNRLDQDASFVTDIELLNKLISDVLRFSTELRCNEIYIEIQPIVNNQINIEITIASNADLDAGINQLIGVSHLRLEEQLLNLPNLSYLPIVIVSALAKESNITFELYSEQQDLTFNFSIPVLTNQQQPSPLSTVKSDYRFLLLDSLDRISGLLIQKYLEPYGTVDYRNSQECTDSMICELMRDYSLIFIDINPASTAKYASLIKHWKKIPEITDRPIIGLSAYLFSEDNQLLLDAGFNECMNKPISKELLHNLLGRYL